ncbi:ABC transporter permease [Pseudoroseicyclus sp. H15]
MFLGDFLALTLSSLVPILAAAMGGMFADRAFVPNIALDGCMLVSALAALAVGVATGSPWIGVLAAVITGTIFALLLALAVFALRCDIIISGIALNLMAVGICLLVVRYLLDSTGTYAPFGVTLIPRLGLGALAEVPVLGAALDRQSALLYVVIAVAILATITMNRTRFGAHVKAVGASEEAAEAVGIKLILVRTLALAISGGLAGIGGAYLSMSSVASFNSQLTGGLGFIAFAAVIFGRATPLGTISAAIIFALASSVAIYLQGTGFVARQLIQALPYVVTVAALALQGILQRGKYDAGLTLHVPAIIPKG